MSSAPIICDNPDCNIAVDGKCIEGLEQQACPNFGRPPPESLEPEEGGPSSAPTVIELSRSIVLEAQSASNLLAERSSRVIGVIAPYDSGKTSLIAAIYDAFQRGPVSTMAFAGSSTLHSFEAACHDSRTASRREEATIFRTPRGDGRYYHIDLCPEEGGEVLTLLLADRAGEEYSMVSSDISNAHNLFEVRRADTLTVLIDGVRLINPKERHNVRAEIEGILQGLLDGSALNKRQRLAIALTKHDAVQNSGRADTAISDFERLVASIRTTFGTYFAAIETFITAASPKVENATRGQGIPELLTFWLREPFVPDVPPVKLQPTRDFERLREDDNA